MIEGRDHASGNNFIMTGPANARGDDIELSGATTDDQEFIAQARQDVPRLLEEVRRGRSMTRGKLLAFHRRPIGFEYPAGFKRAIQRGLVDLGAWTVLDAGHAVALGHCLRQRYPARSVVPFARRVDNDDVACFDVEAPGAVVVIHDYASAGWEARVYRDVYAWLQQAVADMVERDELDDEAERRERVRWKKTWCTDCNQGWVVPLRPPGTSEVLWTCVECESVWTEPPPSPRRKDVTPSWDEVAGEQAHAAVVPIAFADVRRGGEGRFVAVFPRGVVGEAAVIAALAEALRFPDYFGFNWNAVDECIADLSWIAERDVVLHHDDVPALPDDALAHYIDVLHRAELSWCTRDAPHSLRVVFPTAARPLLAPHIHRASGAR
jgi:hypothetical protein